MNFSQELLTLVEKAKAAGVSLEDMVNDLEEAMTTLQDEIEEEEKGED